MSNDIKKEKTKLTDIMGRADKQRMATFMGYLFVFIISIVISAWSVDFNVAKIFDSSFIGNLAFNYTMAIIVLTLSLRDGDIFFQGRKKGDFFEAMKSLKDGTLLVVKRGLSTIFPQYWDMRYEKEKKEFVKQQLEAVQINKVEILELSDEEIKGLMEMPMLKKWDDGHETIFPMINDEQYEIVMKYKKGKYRFPKMAAQTFFSRGSENTYLMVATIDARKKKLTGWSMAFRLAMLLITSTLIYIMVFDALQGSAESAIVSMVSRLFNIFTSMVYGYSVAFDKNKLDVAEVSYKGQIFQEYMSDYDTGMFVPKNIDEEIKKKLAMLEEKAKQEIIDNKIAENGGNVEAVEEEIIMTTDEYKEYLKSKQV